MLSFPFSEINYVTLLRGVNLSFPSNSVFFAACMILAREARNRQYDVYFFIIRTQKREKLWNLFGHACAPIQAYPRGTKCFIYTYSRHEQHVVFQRVYCAFVYRENISRD